MKQFLALFLVSALVISASAELNLQSLSDLLTGFTSGLNYPELNPSLENCSIALNKTKKYANDVVDASEQENPEAFANAVSSFGFTFAQSIRSCGKVIRLVRTLADTIGSSVNNISQDSLSTRLFTNLMAFNMKFNAVKNNFKSGNFLATGENLAEIFKLFVFNDLEIPHRNLAQLEEFTAMLGASPNVAIDILGVIVGVQGFIEEANTTIVVDHYTALVNDSSFFLGQFPALEEAIKAANFSAVVAIATSIYKYIGIVVADYALVKQETVAFVQRDLPLFEDEQKVAKAVESLFLDLPTTLNNIQRIVNSYKIADYRELGHGSGGIYNQLRNGAIGK